MTRRALTLIETLAATVLLALLATTGAELLRSARQSHEATSQPPTVDAVELSLVIADLLAEPGAFGLPDDWRPTATTDRTVQSPDHDWPPIRLIVTESGGLIRPRTDTDENTTNHDAWLIARCERAVTTRWITLPQEPIE